MNDAEFEDNLRDLLRPVAPSADLQRRIRQDLRTADTQPQRVASGRLVPSRRPGFLYRLLRDFGWACAGAAAVLTALAVLPARHVAPLPTTASQAREVTAPAAEPAPASAFEHDGSTNELVSTQNSEQLVETDDGPAREVRYTYVERHAWSNPRTGARVVLEVPREDVYLLPVSLQ